MKIGSSGGLLGTAIKHQVIIKCEECLGKSRVTVIFSRRILLHGLVRNLFICNLHTTFIL
jgi:hypothetical protein